MKSVCKFIYTVVQPAKVNKKSQGKDQSFGLFIYDYAYL